MDRPVRIVKKAASDRDEVGLAALHDGLGLRPFINKPHRDHHCIGIGRFHRAGEIDHIARLLGGRLLVVDIVAARNMEIIVTDRMQRA
ncbi:hypothetical protein D9M73_189420 [compost metagenome]